MKHIGCTIEKLVRNNIQIVEEYTIYIWEDIYNVELNIHDKESVSNMINNGYLFDGEKMVTLEWDYYPKYRHLIEDGKLYKNIHE